MIRMENYRFFSMMHGDGGHCRNSFRKVINSLRLSYASKTPPLLNNPTKESDPYNLIQNHSKFDWIQDGNSNTFIQLKFIINGILQFRETTDPKLIKQLRKRVFENHEVHITVVRELVNNIFKYVHNKYVPNFLGV